MNDSSSLPQAHKARIGHRRKLALGVTLVEWKIMDRHTQWLLGDNWSGSLDYELH